MKKRALITGVAGQDGMYLTELLVSQGYEVFGVVGPEPGAFLGWAATFEGRVKPVAADLTEMASLLAAIDVSRPDEVYNLAAQSWVAASWEGALQTTDVNAVGVLRLLEAIRTVHPDARFCQASSADMFGRSAEIPQAEHTAIHPRSPYGAAKAFGYFITINYRESYGMHASNGIMFNHESPRRGIQFVTRKITDGVARIRHGLAQEIKLGNLDAQRDWGFAGDYVRAMWLMLQQEQPDDYVVASGEPHTVRELCEVAFSRVGLDWEQHVVVDPDLLRPADIDLLVGDSTKAREALGWRPVVSFEETIGMMVDADMERVEAELGGSAR
jgi:GDPmannose 4,6-dehydratase